MPDHLSVTPILPPRFRLGDWIVDAGVGELVGEAGSVPLAGLSMGLLLALARRAGQLCDTDTLIAEVWQRGEVSDATLQQRIKLLRRALDDDSDTPRYILTVRGRGYRLLLQPESVQSDPIDSRTAEIAPVLPAGFPAPSSPRSAVPDLVPGKHDLSRAASDPAPALPPPRRRPWKIATAAAAAVLCAVAALAGGGLLWHPDTRVNRPQVQEGARLVVLPLRTDGAGADEMELADGLTEQLNWTLARQPGLTVIGQNSGMTYKGERRPMAQLAPALVRELGVDVALYGTIDRAGGRVRLDLTLIDVRTLNVRWTSRFDTTSEELTSLHAEVAQQVAQAMHLPASGAGPLLLRGDASTLYLEGRRHYLRYTATDNARAMSLFRASLAGSPAYAPALAGLSDTFAQAVYQFGTPDIHLNDALRYADAAIALAPTLAEGHKARGLALELLGRRHEASASYHTASALNSNYSDALINEAILQWENGHLVTAYRLAQRATALDPLDPYAHLLKVQVLTNAGYVTDAQTILERVGVHAPDNAMIQTIRCAHWLEVEQYERAESECDALLRDHPKYEAGWTLAGDVALFTGRKALAIERYRTGAGLGAGTDALYARLRLATTGGAPFDATIGPMHAQIKRKIARYDEDPEQHLHLAMLEAASGQTEAGMAALEAAVRQGHTDRHWIESDPVLAPLRLHARYPRLLAALDEHLGAERQQLSLLVGPSAAR